MIHFVVALPSEAKPIIDFYQLKRIETSPFEIYSGNDVKLIISKVGMLNAACSVSYLAARHECDGWLNVGLAGHLKAPIGSAYLISKASSLISNKSFYPYLPTKYSGARSALYTLSAPSQDYQSDLLFDMEGYGYFLATLKYTSIEKVHAIKIVSDNPEVNLKTITPQTAQNLVSKNLTLIDEVAQSLKTLKPSLKPCSKLLDSLQLEIFSQTERHTLKRLLNILHFHNHPKATVEILKKLDPKTWIAYLEQLVFDLEIA